MLVRRLRFRNLDGVTGVVGTDYSSLFSRPLNPAVVAWEKRVSGGAAGGVDGEGKE